VNRRVLLTGASGFVGSGVLDYMLSHTDWNFTCLCSWTHHGHPLRVPRDDRVEVVTHDLVGPIPDIGDYDYILHLAAESHVDRSIAEPVAFIENNVSSTLQVLEYARRCPSLRTVLLFSSDEVYGAADHAEWDVLLPSNPYAASKAAAEMIGLAYWRTYGLPLVITNSNNIVGPGQDSEKFLPKLIRLIAAGEEVQIHVTPEGPGRRHYNPVLNVADALLFILARTPTRYEPGLDRPDRYNLAGGEEVDNLRLAEAVAAMLGSQLRYRLVDAEGVRPGYDTFYPKTDGRLTELGWTPVVTLTEGLRQWIR
jgi:dTDP-glucose 4,6-dehydratase